MNNKILSIGIVVLLVPLTSVWAVDLAGNWIAQIEIVENFNVKTDGDNFSETTPLYVETVFSFKVDGNKLTGKVTTPEGDTVISEGIINDDEISFVVKRSIGGKQIIQLYKGKIAGRVYGDEIKFTLEVQGGIGQPLEFTAKREFPLGDYDLPAKREIRKIREIIVPLDPQN